MWIFDVVTMLVGAELVKLVFCVCAKCKQRLGSSAGYLASKLKVTCIRHDFFEFTIRKSYSCIYFTTKSTIMSSETHEKKFPGSELKNKNIKRYEVLPRFELGLPE